MCIPFNRRLSNSSRENGYLPGLPALCDPPSLQAVLERVTRYRRVRQSKVVYTSLPELCHQVEGCVFHDISKGLALMIQSEACKLRVGCFLDVRHANASFLDQVCHPDYTAAAKWVRSGVEQVPGGRGLRACAGTDVPSQPD